ncbi:hypothetical protein HOL82_03400 [Candidatus Woesearchaeota archaeon]|nr:hypothetical protein [Candidatus Woesearchaeota archaeon]
MERALPPLFATVPPAIPARAAMFPFVPRPANTVLVSLPINVTVPVVGRMPPVQLPFAKVVVDMENAHSPIVAAARLVGPVPIAPNQFVHPVVPTAAVLLPIPANVKKDMKVLLVALLFVILTVCMADVVALIPVPVSMDG